MAKYMCDWCDYLYDEDKDGPIKDVDACPGCGEMIENNMYRVDNPSVFRQDELMAEYEAKHPKKYRIFPF